MSDDNVKRAGRLMKLAYDIRSLQSIVISSIEKARRLDETAFSILSKITEQAGVTTIEQRLAEAQLGESITLRDPSGLSKDQLHSFIIEFCVLRFRAKITAVEVTTILTFIADARGLIDYQGVLQGFVETGKITQAKASEMIEDKMKAVIARLIQDIKNVDKKKVYDELAVLDKARDSWTNEDPSFEEIVKGINEIAVK
ncbi:hypothetical protein AMATHDRAFT_8590 [Amanita thiersii Skay4041]|uniref:Uncharacterized protein n=1 Tax=Amanita thiersii Skay4041 TaxID=703135 RepID=A0A2A9NC55_9AGAR|nr:hypothetical protein AMATHDRAFT_8590 [Amanita thiersii Skay4041]